MTSAAEPVDAPSLRCHASGTGGGRWLPLLLILFAGSGCSALIYEIVWFQLIQLVIGSSAVSLGVLLGTFMGGMCLGSLFLPRLISRSRHPLRVYALLELGIGLSGIAILLAMPRVDALYAAHVGHGWHSILLRAALCAVCLLPPTLLMGATLPAMARWIEVTPRGAAWLGLFYSGNIAGAVFGCLLAGFYLLRLYDMATATYVAASLNGIVAVLAIMLSFRASYSASRAEGRDGETIAAAGSWAFYVVIALSGLCALGAEVVWTRLLSLMLGATVYTFSIILAVFLVGLGIGSSLGSLLWRLAVPPRVALGLCQLLLAAAAGWAAYSISTSLPYWPINPTLATSPWHSFQLDVLRCAWAILPAACLWGASFPMALAGVASSRDDSGRVVGKVYAANTIGAIVGAIGFSMLLIPRAGTQNAQRALIGLAALGAVLMFAPVFRAASGQSPAAGRSRRLGVGVAIAGMAIAMALGALLVWSVPPVNGDLIAFGRFLPTYTADDTLLYVGEGMNASIAVSEWPDGSREFHVSGKVEASSQPRDMRLQRMLGHLPALLHPGPQSVLVVGCGAGVTAGSFVVHPGMQRIVICEIEPLIPTVVAQYFSNENHDVVHDKRVEIVYDDARHYVLTTPEKFDIVTSDPIHPWVKGAATLYTREYFELCKQHLKPGGVVTQWVPLYESSPEAVKSEIATFMQVFPNGTIWSNQSGVEGYDIVLLGQVEPLAMRVDEFQRRLDRPDHRDVAHSLEEVGFKSGMDLLCTYAGCGSDLAPWLKDAQINRDGNLRLQYLAGLGLNRTEAPAIHNQMLGYRKFPAGQFIGGDQKLLREAISPRN